MGVDGIDGDVELGGNLLAAEALGHQHEDLLLAVAEVVVLRRHEEQLLDHGVLLQVAAELHDVEHEFHHLLVEAFAGDVLVDDLREVGELVLDVVVAFHVVVGDGLAEGFAVGEVVEHGDEVALLAAHVVAHLATVVGEVFLQHSRRLVAGALGHMVEVVLHVGQALLDVVAVAGLQMLHHQAVVDGGHLLVVGAVVVEAVYVAHRQEEILVHTALAADLLHAFLAEAQGNAETRQHQDKVVVRRYHVCHLHAAGENSPFAHSHSMLYGVRHLGFAVQKYEKKMILRECIINSSNFFACNPPLPQSATPHGHSPAPHPCRSQNRSPATHPPANTLSSPTIVGDG